LLDSLVIHGLRESWVSVVGHLQLIAFAYCSVQPLQCSSGKNLNISFDGC